VVCNTGVGLTPSVNGTIHHFDARGLYDGVQVMRDEETGTLWHHITGEAMIGPLKGHTLGPIRNLDQTTVEATLETYPDMPVAISDRPIRRENRWDPLRKVPGLSKFFQSTIAREDSRRPTMDIGIGLWTDDQQHAAYYPMEAITAAGGFIFDHLAGRRVVIYFGPKSRALRAVYAPASAADWDGDDLVFSTGHRLSRGILYDPSGVRAPADVPLQLFTRWYGFSLTFPHTTVWETPRP
jgi:hypothetical protein